VDGSIPFLCFPSAVDMAQRSVNAYPPLSPWRVSEFPESIDRDICGRKYREPGWNCHSVSERASHPPAPHTPAPRTTTTTRDVSPKTLIACAASLSSFKRVPALNLKDSAPRECCIHSIHPFIRLSRLAFVLSYNSLFPNHACMSL